MSTAHVQAEEWTGEDVGIGDVERALSSLRSRSAHGTEGPDMRTSVMTHLAWVPREWRDVAVETLAGLGELHPSRVILLFPEPKGADGIDAKVSVLAFPLGSQRRHIAAEVIELHLRGRLTEAPASIVVPLLVSRGCERGSWPQWEFLLSGFRRTGTVADRQREFLPVNRVRRELSPSPHQAARGHSVDRFSSRLSRIAMLTRILSRRARRFCASMG